MELILYAIYNGKFLWNISNHRFREHIYIFDKCEASVELIQRGNEPIDNVHHYKCPFRYTMAPYG